MVTTSLPFTVVLVSVTRHENSSHAPLRPCAVREAWQLEVSRESRVQPLVTVLVGEVSTVSGQLDVVPPLEPELPLLADEPLVPLPLPDEDADAVELLELVVLLAVVEPVDVVEPVEVPVALAVVEVEELELLELVLEPQARVVAARKARAGRRFMRSA